MNLNQKPDPNTMEASFSNADNWCFEFLFENRRGDILFSENLTQVLQTMTPSRLNNLFEYLKKGSSLDYSSVMRLFKEWVLCYRSNKRAEWEKDPEAKKSAEKLKQSIKDWTRDGRFEVSFDGSKYFRDEDSDYESDSDECGTDIDVSSEADSEFPELNSFAVNSIE